jgi:GNAT superfamily N-acetyltransferase
MKRDLELVEFGPLSLRQWVELTGHEPAPFGATTATLSFRAKDHHVGFRDTDGRLVAAVGATVVTVSAANGQPFEVVGGGGLIVRRELRGQGLSTALTAALRTLVLGLGPDRAMIFCEPDLLELHMRRGYTRIEAPIFVDQPDGRIEMPLLGMWRPVRPSAWPPGRIDVQGLPF